MNKEKGAQAQRESNGDELEAVRTACRELLGAAPGNLGAESGRYFRSYGESPLALKEGGV